MIHFESYALIIRKSTLIEKYEGGIEQFKLDLPNNSFQEDDQLAIARFLKFEHINHFIYILSERLHYDHDKFYSEDFAVISHLGEWWRCDWLKQEVGKCWINEQL